MIAIVPLAGRSVRFGNFTSRPKWALDMGGMPALGWALSSLQELELDKIVLAVREDQVGELLACLKKIPVSSNLSWTSVGGNTSGQAETVRKALQKIDCPQTASLLIWNGDCMLRPGWSTGLGQIDGNGLVVSRLEGEHWSFAYRDQHGRVRVVEKQRISELASTGLYLFSSCGDFMNLPFAPEGESFVGPLYNFLGRQSEVALWEVSPSMFVPFGTPGEMFVACATLRVEAPFELLDLDV